MRRHHASALLLLLLLAIAPLPAGASALLPDVLIRPQLPSRPIADGQGYAIPVDVLVRSGLQASALSARPMGAMKGRELAPMQLAPGAERPGGEDYHHQRYLLEGTLEPGLDAISLEVLAGGTRHSDTIRLRGLEDPVAEDVVLTRGPDASSPLAASAAAGPGGEGRPEAVPSGYPEIGDEPGLLAPRSVQVQGRVLMRVGDDGTDRGVDGATVYFMQVRDILDDLELGRGTTDSAGNFDFPATMDGIHEVYIKVRAINGDVNVGTDAGFQTYGRNTLFTRGFYANSFGPVDIRFTDDMNHALWLTSTYTRVRRWFTTQGSFLPPVNCRWPDDVLGSSCYLPVWGMEGIHLRSEATWDGGTVVHEYGHHYVAASPVQEVWPPFYTNGVCDPGHCIDCPENEAVAWSEGLPYFTQRLFADAHTAAYGWSLPLVAGFESPQDCRETGALSDNPPSTEGFLAAYLWDLVDGNPDSTPLAPSITETSELPATVVLSLAATSGVSNSIDFVAAVNAHLAGPGFTDQQRRGAWQAAAVNGFASDSMPPTPPVISSLTHQPGTSTPANQPVLFFSGATDDQSGISHYRVDIAATAGPPGPSAATTEDEFIRWPSVLPEGSYHANVTSVDWAGNESAPASYGPLVVGPSSPIDLDFHRPPLWEDELLLRHDTTVTASAGAIEPVLVGGQDVWFSLTAHNASASSAAVEPFYNLVLVDHEILAEAVFSPGTMAAGQEFQFTNVGPFQVPGGRHTIVPVLDMVGVTGDGVPGNNVQYRYYVFRPDILPPGSSQAFPEGPKAYTRLNGSSIGPPNRAGHRLAPPNQYGAAVLSTQGTGTNYMMTLHAISTGYDNGFSPDLAVSVQPEGRTESIVANMSALGMASFDVGIQKSSVGDQPGYTLSHVTSQELLPGDSTVVSWSATEGLALLEFSFTVLETGPFTVVVDASFDPTGSPTPIQAHWMDPSMSTLVPATATPVAATGEDGRMTLELDVPSSGNYCLVLYRDFGYGSEAGPVSIAVGTDGQPLPDFSIFEGLPGWDMPMIPYGEPDPKNLGGLPPVLPGGSYDTWLNFVFRNSGQLGATGLEIIAGLDGDFGNQFFWDQGDIGPQETILYRAQSPVFVPGGRHTMTLQLDPNNTIAERDETNNQFSMQLGWSGPELVPFLDVVMASAPPDPTAGAEHLRLYYGSGGDPGEEGGTTLLNHLAPNSDGFRVVAPLNRGAASQHRWTAIATMPGDSSNVDLRLHEVMPPARAFAAALVASTSGVGESDFVVVDLDAAGSQPYDVSVVNAGGEQGYRLVQLNSTDLGPLQGSSTNYGPFGLDGGGFLRMHEVYVPAGDYQVTLVPQSADAALGITLFEPTTPLASPYRTKDQRFEDRPATASGGPGELLQVQDDLDPERGGWVCIAVWKVGAGDLAANQDYILNVQVVPDDPPCIAVDGIADDDYGPPRAVQQVQSSAGDSGLGHPSEANGSELDQLFATICDDVLYLSITGNLASDYSDLEIFLDTRPGGQPRLLGGHGGFPGAEGLNRMGASNGSNGLRFDAGLEMDWWFSLQGGTDEVGAGVPYRLHAYMAELLDGGGGEGRYLGATRERTTGLLEGAGASWWHGVRATLDNSNAAGVTAGQGPDSGAGVLTGVELAIPLAAIGDPTGCIRGTVLLNGVEHELLSNQVLPPLPAGTASLGDPRNVNLWSQPGDQFFTVCQPSPTGTGDDHPHLAAKIVELHPAVPNPFNPRTTLSFTLPQDAPVELVLFDLAGRRVRTLLAGTPMAAGRHEIVWDGRDDAGRSVSSGSYRLRLVAGGERRAQGITLLE